MSVPRETTPTAASVLADAARVRRLIDRLWNTHTPVSEIRSLYHDLDIATANDLRRLTTGGRT
jgi:hypothetical protein